jgi:hypothetical protein
LTTKNTASIKPVEIYQVSEKSPSPSQKMEAAGPSETLLNFTPDYAVAHPTNIGLQITHKFIIITYIQQTSVFKLHINLLPTARPIKYYSG